MIKYEIFEIEKNNFMKILKCNSSEVEKCHKPKATILIIPGNPGVIEFYEQFAINLHNLTGYNVIGLSHTGHIYDENIKHWVPKDVNGQIKDKIKFIENHLLNIQTDKNNNEEHGEIILIGHSIGCYIILQILAHLDMALKQRVKKAYLLFPTIERMSETPNGKILTFFTQFFMWLIYFVAYLLTFLPDFLQKFMVDKVFTKRHNMNDMHENLDKVVLKMSKQFACVRSCFHMGHDEMNKVKQLNIEVIKKNSDLLKFYYGSQDRWCPLDFYHAMKTRLNSVLEEKKVNEAIILDTYGLDHAFVIFRKQTTIISQLIATWIEKL